jgi:hypothetical protein
MSVTVPAGHPAKAHFDKVANHVALITANAVTNPPLANMLKVQLPALQVQLVDALMADGSLPASAILSTMTFHAADTNVA